LTEQKEQKEQKEKRRMSTQEVKKLPKDSTFYVLGVVSRFAQRRDKNDNPFWDISLMDGEGQIDGKIWGSSEWWNISGEAKQKITPADDEILKSLDGKTVGVQGKIVAFRDQNQCNFNAVYYVDQEKYPPHSFVRRSPVPMDEMESAFLNIIETCGQPMRTFLEYIFFDRDVWKAYRTWPAAISMHHAYVSGLLEHSLSVARSAISIAQSYKEKDFYIDLDVVIAGALLHDLGKLESYRLSPAPEVTVGGNVVDHIVMGYHRFMTLVDEYKKTGASAKGVNAPAENRILAIGHILVSHHGTREFGSPVLPSTPEALVVSVADELDFKLFCWKEHTSQLDGGKEVTEYVPSVQRRFWKGCPSEKTENETRSESNG